MSTARKTAPRASLVDGARSNAALSASRCGAGISATSPMTGETSSSRPEKEICDSSSTPVVRSTSNSCARSTACARRAVRPDPAAPQMTSTPLSPERASASSLSIRARSAACPCRSARGRVTGKGLAGREPSSRVGVRRATSVRHGPMAGGRLHGSVIGRAGGPLYFSRAIGTRRTGWIRAPDQALPGGFASESSFGRLSPRVDVRCRSGSDGGRALTLHLTKSRSDDVNLADHHHEPLLIHRAVRSATPAVSQSPEELGAFSQRFELLNALDGSVVR